MTPCRLLHPAPIRLPLPCCPARSDSPLARPPLWPSCPQARLAVRRQKVEEVRAALLAIMGDARVKPRSLLLMGPTGTPQPHSRVRAHMPMHLRNPRTCTGAWTRACESALQRSPSWSAASLPPPLPPPTPCAGAGKTATVRCLANELQCEVSEWVNPAHLSSFAYDHDGKPAAKAGGALLFRPPWQACHASCPFFLQRCNRIHRHRVSRVGAAEVPGRLADRQAKACVARRRAGQSPPPRRSANRLFLLPLPHLLLCGRRTFSCGWNAIRR